MIVCPYTTHTGICNRYDNDDTLYYSYMIKSDVCVLICDSGRIKPDRACDLWTKCYVLAEVSPKHHLSPKVSPMSTVGAQCHQIEHSWSTVSPKVSQNPPLSPKVSPTRSITLGCEGSGTFLPKHTT